jgi:hypothetical protein
LRRFMTRFPALPEPTCDGDWSWPREAATEAHFDS